MNMGKRGTALCYRLWIFFVCLRVLSDKCSKAFANELKSIYFGPSLVTQSDQGRELKGAVNKNCVEI